MRMSYFSDAASGMEVVTVWGTYEQWKEQRDWAVDEFDEEPVIIGEPYPYPVGNLWSWNVWQDDYEPTRNLTLFKLTWGGAI